MSHRAITGLREIHLRGPVRAERAHRRAGFARLNRAVAVQITRRVGTMWCAYVFTGIGAGSLVGVITGNTVLALICGAVSSYLLQLVLLPVIMVGQNVQAATADARAETDHEILGHEAEILATLHELQVEQSAILRRLDPERPRPPAGVRLGRLPTPPERRARNWRLDGLPYRLPAGPPALDITTGISAWPMYANDRLGDCTAAAAAHMEEVWSDQVAGQPFLVTDQDVIALYETQGYRPADPSTDQGAYLPAVLDAWRKVGLGGRHVKAYAEVSVTDRSAVESAAWLFSGLYIGINLPISAQGQAVWDVPPGGPTGQGAPGSWGGHCVNVVGYDASGLAVVTWGALKRMTWAFWTAYVDEAYAVFPTDYDRLGRQLLPNGLTEAELIADLETMHPTPDPVPAPDPPSPPPPSPHRSWWRRLLDWLQEWFGYRSLDSIRWATRACSARSSQ